MTAPFRLARLKSVEASAMIAPVYNILVSMAFLHTITPQEPPTDLPEQIDPWLISAARALQNEQLQTNRLIFEALGSAILPKDPNQEFSEYLKELAQTPGEALVNRLVVRFVSSTSQITREKALLLHDFNYYLERVRVVFHNDLPDLGLHQQAWKLLNDPAALKALILQHLAALWDGLFASEWQKRRTLIQALVGALQQRSVPQGSASEVVRAFIGRDLPAEMGALLLDIKRINFVPTPHLSLYASTFDSNDTLWIFVAMGTITGWALRQAPIRSNEVLARIGPLADQINLQILDLLAQHGELLAQDLMSMLGLSQSSASRHLKELGSYIIERRDQGASKRYRLNIKHLDWTLITLRRFLMSGSEYSLESASLMANGRGFAPSSAPLGPRSAVLPTAPVPTELRRFMDEQGRLNAFPTRRRDQLLVLDFLVERFEMNRNYTEKEVNATISACLNPLFYDVATLRRELCNMNLLARERDGSRYWRPSISASNSNDS